MSGRWIRARLGDVFTTVTGGTPSKAKADLFGTFMPLVKPPELVGGPLDSAEDGLSESGVRSARILPVESVLVSCIGNLGKVGVNTVPVAFNQQINAVLPNRTAAIPKFMFYQVQSPAFKSQLEESATGTTVRIVNKSKFNEIEIVLAPIFEQRRIVAILDEAFEAIATVEANTASNLQESRGLFEGYLQAAFAKRGVGWIDRPLGSLCTIFADGDWIESKDQSDAGIRLIQTGNVGEGAFKHRVEKARYISEGTFERLRCTEIFPGDCLISRLPDPVGRSCILQDTGERMITAVDCTIARFDLAMMMPAFFSHFTRTKNYLFTVAEACTGATRSRISRSNLAMIPIPVPPIAEQTRLAAVFDSVQKETMAFAEICERKLAGLVALRESILDQAFAGKLTTKSVARQVEAAA